MNRLAALALAFALALPALALPTQVEAVYRVSMAGVPIGRVVESFVRDGDSYRIESTTHTEGIGKVIRDDTAVLRSEGRVGPGGLQPQRFEQRIAGDRARDIHAEFDWEKAELRSDYRGERTTHALPAGTQDSLSLMYQFMSLDGAAERVQVHMSNGRKVDLYTYRRVEEVALATPAGEFSTVHYERVTESDRENRAEVWLARDRFNLPVRIVFMDTRGLRLERTLLSLTTR